MSAIDLSWLNSALGAYCRENAAEILHSIYLNMDFAKRYKHIPNVRDEVPLMRINTGSILQQRNSSAFTPTANAINLSARLLKVRGAKVDLELDVQPLWTTSFGHTLKPSGQNLIAFVESLVLGVVPKTAEEIHLQVAFKGVYQPATPNLPTAVTDGWLKIIADEILSGTLSGGNGNLVTTGPITSVNAVDSLRLMWQALPEVQRTRENHMYVSPEIYEFYRWDYDAIYNQSVVYTGTGKYGADIVLAGTNTTIICEPGLAGSQRVILTAPKNMTYGTNDPTDVFYQPRVEKVDRLFRLYLDFGVGFQFAQVDNGALIVNDQL